MLRPGPDIVAELARAVEAWDADRDGPGPNVALVGAEPFSHPELPAIVFAATEAGTARIRLRTGGEALQVRENAGGVIHAGVRQVEIVALAAGAHDALCGRPDAFAAVAAGVDAYLAAAKMQHATVALTARIPVCRHNLEHLPDAVAALSQLGASEVVLDLSPAAAASVGAAGWVASACDTGVVNGTWVSVLAPSRIAGVPELHFVAVAAPSSTDEHEIAP